MSNDEIWERVLDKETVPHCKECPHLDLKDMGDYVSLQCWHPETVSKYEDLLDHEPDKECPEEGRIGK